MRRWLATTIRSRDLSSMADVRPRRRLRPDTQPPSSDIPVLLTEIHRLHQPRPSRKGIIQFIWAQSRLNSRRRSTVSAAAAPAKYPRRDTEQSLECREAQELLRLARIHGLKATDLSEGPRRPWDGVPPIIPPCSSRGNPVRSRGDVPPASSETSLRKRSLLDSVAQSVRGSIRGPRWNPSRDRRAPSRCSAPRTCSVSRANRDATHNSSRRNDIRFSGTTLDFAITSEK